MDNVKEKYNIDLKNTMSIDITEDNTCDKCQETVRVSKIERTNLKNVKSSNSCYYKHISKTYRKFQIFLNYPS